MPLKTPTRRPSAPRQSPKDKVIAGKKDSGQKKHRENIPADDWDEEVWARAAGKSARRASPKETHKQAAHKETRKTPHHASASHKKTISQPLPPLFNLSDERKLDVLGVILALVGLMILLSLLSGSNSLLTGWLVTSLKFLFGWGAYLIPLALFGFGVWLVARKIDRIPPVSLERVTGALMLTLFALVVLQALTPKPIDTMAGGGWFGRIFYDELLEKLLGDGGASVVLFAWFLIGLIFTFDLSLPEIVALLQPAWNWLRRLGAALFRRSDTFSQPGADYPAGVPVEDGFTPAHPVPPPTASSVSTVVPVTVTGPQQAWVLPDVKEILSPGKEPSENEEYVQQRARLIEETLASFGAPSQVVEINRGPTVTQFGVEPLFVETRGGRTRVRVSKIVSLSDDLALALAAPRIRIQAPVPGHSYLGIEVPNEEMTVVALRDLVESEPFRRARKSLSFALGQDVSGHPIGAELTNMPHLLIAGTTGSGKSVCVNAILSCLLLYNTPDDVRLVLVDPKRVELTGYNGVPHLLSPVVVEMEKVIGALQWMTREMDRRYHSFAQVGARNIIDYNARMKAQGQKKLPYLVVVIDELADLMMLAPDETERTITRLAQLARATGIHLILATQRPSVDVVTGLIKANFPARVAFAVASNTDSRVILDQPGAERLLGRGDMLYQAPDAPAPVRLQGVFVSDTEIHRLVDFWRAQNVTSPATGSENAESLPGAPLKQIPIWEEAAAEQGDPLYSEALDLIRREGRASVSMLQRKFRIGYTRASRLVDTLEEKKIIGPPEDNTGVRKVLDYGPAGPPKESER